MQFHRVTGGGGTHLNVVESGNPKGCPILYIHGLSQCWLQWSRQINSDLAQDHRLVAMDMRGHGLSDKPLAGYEGSKMWADDVSAVIETLELDNPVLCGWSYGPLVILDYIRHYGEERVGGLHFVGGGTKLGNEEALAALTPEFLGLGPGFFSSDVNESVRSLDGLLRLCLINNDDILPAIRKPVLITHGAQDAIVKPSVVEQHKASIAHAEIQMMQNVGHAAFWDDAASFNRRQREFAARLGQAARAEAS